MKVAVIGLGVMGKNHLRVLQAIEDVREIVVYDLAAVKIDDPRKVEFSQSLDDLIATKPDYAVVAIPTAIHAPIALALAKKGIATLLEKPVAATLSESETIAKAFSETTTLCAIGHVERFNPALQVLKTKISDGVIGKPIQISSIRVGPFPNRVNDVGVLRDLGSHDIDLAMWLTGLKYQGLSAMRAHTRDSQHEDLFVAVGRLGDEILVNHTVNWLNPVKVRQTSVLGTNGLLVADSLRAELRFFENGVQKSEWGQYTNLRGLAEGGEVRYPVPVREPLVSQHEAMIRSVNQGFISEMCSIGEGIEVMKVIEGILGQ